MVKTTLLLLILFFTAEWCIACKEAKPSILLLMLEGYDIEIVDHPDKRFKKHNITKLPTLLINKKKVIGTRTKEQYREAIDEEMD